jgi:hypothetical protein
MTRSHLLALLLSACAAAASDTAADVVASGSTLEVVEIAVVVDPTLPAPTLPLPPGDVVSVHACTGPGEPGGGGCEPRAWALTPDGDLALYGTPATLVRVVLLTP